jgi:hypothetical protein
VGVIHHGNSFRSASLLRQKDQEHYHSKGTKYLSPEIAVSISKFTSILLPAPLHRIAVHCFFRPKFVMNLALFITEVINALLNAGLCKRKILDVVDSFELQTMSRRFVP